jgi:hypothetical protein
MKVRLMQRDSDLDLPPALAGFIAGSAGVRVLEEQETVVRRALPRHAQALTQDLELDTLFAAMAAGDRVLLNVVRQAVFASLIEPQEIVYRQQVLADCLEHPAVVRQIYDLAVEAIAGERQNLGLSKWSSPDMILRRSVGVLELFVDVLRRLRQLADEHGGAFRSEGFTELFAELSRELDDDYLRTIDGHLRILRFRAGVPISAELGKGNRGTRYVLRRSPPRKRGLRGRFFRGGRPSFTYQIADRDEAGAKALAALRDRGIDLVANALAQSCDHVLSYFRTLRAELGFYVGCVNLHEYLVAKGEPTCFPVPEVSGEPSFACRGLYDVCLSLSVTERVVGNDVTADGKSVVMVTGANQGGKSTFLRSVGLAQLMLQCGMFVAAESFRADVRTGVFTHFKREEDATMRSGKLDEELGRMSEIADDIHVGAILLFNESFASTNEREGSEIARQIIGALRETGAKVFFVTHMFELANGLFRSPMNDSALFLRAERQADGSRTFRLVEGEPLSTSYGEDLYRRIFADDGDARVVSGSD